MRWVWLLLLATRLAALHYEPGIPVRQTLLLQSTRVDRFSGTIGTEQSVLTLVADLMVEEVDDDGRVRRLAISLQHIDGRGRLAPSFDHRLIPMLPDLEEEEELAWMQWWKRAALQAAMKEPLRYEFDDVGEPRLVEESMSEQFTLFPRLHQFLGQVFGWVLLKEQFEPVEEGGGEWVTLEHSDSENHLLRRWNVEEPLFFELDEVTFLEQRLPNSYTIIHRSITSTKLPGSGDAVVDSDPVKAGS